MNKKQCEPFLKWVGGKRQLLSQIEKYMPNEYNNYFEPFIGGGALFFKLSKSQSTIIDLNEELINVYKIIAYNPVELIQDLKKHKNNKEYFYKIRELDRNDSYILKTSDIERASRFIYLNKTCFNGLYRVNKKGQFNVPFGNYKKVKYIDEENILNCSKLLKKTNIIHGNFLNIEKIVKENDFVYFDPPYIPLNETSNFTSYTKENFNLDTQIELKKLCDRLTNNNIKFLLSNSNSDLVRDLYKDYEIIEVLANRSINSKADGRKKIKELLVRNFNK